MSNQQGPNRPSLGDHPIVVLITTIAAVFSIIVFVTGKQNLLDFWNSAMPIPAPYPSTQIPVSIMVPTMIPASSQQGAEQATNGGTILSDIVTSKKIASNNRPVDVTDVFGSPINTVYVVVKAERIEPDTEMFARWSRNGTPFEESSLLKANKVYNNIYVEFHITSLYGPMGTGNYTVQVFVDGEMHKQATFTVR